MRGRAVEVEVVLFDIFAVVGLAIHKAERAFSDDGVFAIPQSHAKTRQLLLIADAGKTILTPVICTRSSLIMSGRAIPVLAVVLANRTPLPLAEVRVHIFSTVSWPYASPLVWPIPDLGPISRLVWFGWLA
jgi:hypothetical protein